MHQITVYRHIPESIDQRDPPCRQRKIRKDSLRPADLCKFLYRPFHLLSVFPRNHNIQMQLHQRNLLYIRSILFCFLQVAVDRTDHCGCSCQIRYTNDLLLRKDFQIFTTVLKTIQAAGICQNPAHLILQRIQCLRCYQFIQFFFNEKLIIPIFHTFPPSCYDYDHVMTIFIICSNRRSVNYPKV